MMMICWLSWMMMAKEGNFHINADCRWWELNSPQRLNWNKDNIYIIHLSNLINLKNLEYIQNGFSSSFFFRLGLHSLCLCNTWVQDTISSVYMCLLFVNSKKTGIGQTKTTLCPLQTLVTVLLHNDIICYS